jgi:hypothetical protein
MRTDTSLDALRDASPRNQPGFDDWIDSFDSLGTQIPAIPVPTRRPLPVPDSRHRRVVGLGVTVAVAAAVVGVVVGLALTAASPPSAEAAARRALAATAAAPSGTMTTTLLHAGVTQTIDADRWNGSDIAFSPGFGPIQQLLLIGGGMYVQSSDGTWLHYANASDVGPKPLGGLAQLAKDNIAATTPQQILALATGIQQTTQPDGTTLYTGTIPSTSIDPANVPGNDAITSMILGAQKRADMIFGGAGGDTPGSSLQNDLQFEMSLGGDGLVRQVSVTFQQNGTYTWTVTYSQLGSTPPITAPATSTDVPPGTLPPGIPQPGTPQNTPTQTTQTPQITPADQADYLKAAECMRTHGVLDFPDPTFENNTVTFNVPPNIDPNSSQAKNAVATCSIHPDSARSALQQPQSSVRTAVIRRGLAFFSVSAAC